MENSEALSTFKLALSMRSAAPRIEAHYQYYDTAVAPSLGKARTDCAEWVLMSGKQYCSASLAHADGHISGDSYVPYLDIIRPYLT